MSKQHLLCRNEKLAIQVLAESTLAAQEGVIHYLAAAAGLQQWGQAALAFLALWRSEQGMSPAQLGEAVESALEDSFRVSALPLMPATKGCLSYDLQCWVLASGPS